MIYTKRIISAYKIYYIELFLLYNASMFSFNKMIYFTWLSDSNIGTES